MEEDFKNRRLKRSQQEQYNAGVQSLRAIFDQLNPQEQNIVRLLNGLDGERIHSRDEIFEKYDTLSMSDLRLLDIKIERMMRIQKKGARAALRRGTSEDDQKTDDAPDEFCEE